MDLGGNKRGVRDVVLFQPGTKQRGIPFMTEAGKAAACRKSAGGYTKPTDMVKRQRKAPAAVRSDAQVVVHRSGRSEQGFLAKHDPGRLSRTAGGCEAYAASRKNAGIRAMGITRCGEQRARVSPKIPTGQLTRLPIC